jgi:hypothetical protein
MITTNPEIRHRIDELSAELESKVKYYRRTALLNHFITLAITVLTLAASATAGLGGLFFDFSGKVAGGIALLPGIFGLIVASLKPHAKANWHYRKVDALQALGRRLKYELPEMPTADNVAAISSALSDLERSMTREWEKDLTSTWDHFTRREGPGSSRSNE